METYTLLRGFADSWFLLAMFSFFLGAGLWAFWPSQRPARLEAALIPFREKEVKSRTNPCAKNCADCACKIDFLKGVHNG